MLILDLENWNLGFIFVADGAAAVALFGLIYYEMHIEETPFTKRRRFVVFNQKQLAEISEQQKTMVSYDVLVVAKHSIMSYCVVCRIYV